MKAFLTIESKVLDITPWGNIVAESAPLPMSESPAKESRIKNDLCIEKFVIQFCNLRI